MAYVPGDFILTHGDQLFSTLIRVGQRLRYGSSSPYTFYNHAALIVSPEGDLLEALGNGIVRSHISKYAEDDRSIVSIESVISDMGARHRVLEFAKSCEGRPYDWVDIASISVSLLTGTKLLVVTDNHLICSGFVARALERTNAIFPHASQRIMPADLAQYFNVHP